MGDALVELEKVSFCLDKQGDLFDDQPVVLLSDASDQIRALESEIRDLKRKLDRKARKHPFPDVLDPVEEDRIQGICARWGVEFEAVCHAARLYSEQGGAKYNSWPAAIELALGSDYGWIRGARTRPRQSLASPRRDRAGAVARKVLGE